MQAYDFLKSVFRITPIYLRASVANKFTWRLVTSVTFGVTTEPKTVGGAMESMPKPSLQQMLATIPSLSLNQKVNDAHLAEIARELIDWKSVCTKLGISEAEEVAIEEENQRADARRYVELLLCSVSLCVLFYYLIS